MVGVRGTGIMEYKESVKEQHSKGQVLWEYSKQRKGCVWIERNGMYI